MTSRQIPVLDTDREHPNSRLAMWKNRGKTMGSNQEVRRRALLKHQKARRAEALEVRHFLISLAQPRFFRKGYGVSRIHKDQHPALLFAVPVALPPGCSDFCLAASSADPVMAFMTEQKMIPASPAR